LRCGACACHDPGNVQLRFVLAMVPALGFLFGCRGGRATAPPAQAAPTQLAPSAGAAEDERSPTHPSGSPGLSAAVPAGQVSHVPGLLDHPERLAKLFERLSVLEDGHGRQDVSVLQYGDSHTASDMGVGVLRHALQARFGDGGRGFVPIGRPWKSFYQEGVRGGMTREFVPVMITWHAGHATGDGLFGLLGVGIEGSRAGARAWSDVTAHASHAELAYLEQPQGGAFDVLVDGAPVGHVESAATEPQSGYFPFDVTDAPHTIEVRLVGNRPVRLFGLSLDRPEAGVVIDTLGINGAQIFTPLHYNEQHFAEQLRHAAPDLVVLAYGTNEAVEEGLVDADYERRLGDLLARFAAAAPGAACLLLGPPDLARRAKGEREWKTWPRVPEIIAIQRRAAQAAGCAFYDQLAAMGGPGSMVAWALGPEPRAQGDHVHLTRSGYTQLATSFATDLLHAYDEWRAERASPPGAQAPSPLASQRAQ
jgi:lysophospholipase L1-like esterase